MGNILVRREKRLSNVELGGELIEEILCKLPVKSLLRFKTVCKSWNLLINSHYFIYKHLHRKNSQLGGYSLQLKDPNLVIDVSCIVDACNGIICTETKSYKKSLILYNPSTREFSFLPPECDGHYFGFCYHPKTQEYQIVSFHLKCECAFKKIDIKTLTLGKITSWRYAKNIPVPGRIAVNFRNATSGTTMYWLGQDHDGKNEMVICYDVIEGRFSEMNMPPITFYSRLGTKSLRVLKGSLIMFVNPVDGPRFSEIWMLIDDVSNGKSWIKYQTIGPLETLVYPIDVCWYDRWILCSTKSYTGGYRNDNLFYYDLETNQVKDYCDLQTDLVEDYEATDPPIYMFVNYVESLVSIKSLVPYIDTVLPTD